MSGEPVGAAACGGGEARTVMKGRGKGTRGRGRGRGQGGGDRSFSAPAMNAVAVGDRVLRERRHPPNTLCERDTDDDDEEAPNKQVKPKRPKISDAAKKGPRKAIAVQMGSEAQFPNAKGHVEMNEGRKP